MKFTIFISSMLICRALNSDFVTDSNVYGFATIAVILAFSDLIVGVMMLKRD